MALTLDGWLRENAGPKVIFTCYHPHAKRRRYDNGVEWCHSCQSFRRGKNLWAPIVRVHAPDGPMFALNNADGYTRGTLVAFHWRERLCYKQHPA